MTDKEQIIIDSVDVSECEFHQIEANELYPKAHYCGSMKNTFCENDPNCYFKQLARKTQIVEQQQKTLDEIIGCVSLWEQFSEEESKLAKDSSIADLIMLIRKKTQECEELKAELELNTQNAVTLDIAKRLYNYRKALEEIEKIVKINCEEICGRKFEDCNDTSCFSVIDILTNSCISGVGP